MRVLPVPVGPSSRKMPTGRPSGLSPAWCIWMYGTMLCIAVVWPTTLRVSSSTRSRSLLASGSMADVSEWLSAVMAEPPVQVGNAGS